MSHNAVKILNLEPDQNGQINLTFSALLPLNPQDQDVLKMGPGNAWTSGSVPAVARLVPASSTATSDYAVSTYDYAAGDNLIIFKSNLNISGVTLLDASGSYVPVENSNWSMGFRFDGNAWSGKTVILKAVPAPDCQASFISQWGFGTGSLATFEPIGPKAQCDSTWSDMVWGRFVGDGTTKDVALKIIERTGFSSYLQLADGARAAHYSITIKAF